MCAWVALVTRGSENLKLFLQVCEHIFDFSPIVRVNVFFLGPNGLGFAPAEVNVLQQLGLQIVALNVDH